MSARMAALVLAGLFATLSWLSYFPVDAGWLGWVATSPFLILARIAVSPRFRYFAAWLSGIGFFLPALMWMRVADEMMYFSWIGMSLYCSLFSVLAMFLLRVMDRTGLPLVAGGAVAWTAADYLRGTLMGGFAWYFPAHTQHHFLPFAQIADLGGVYLITLLVVAVNGLLADFLTRGVSPRWGLAVVCTLVASFGYGHWQLGRAQSTPGPVVSLLQGNVPQGVKNDFGEAARLRIVGEYKALQDRAASARPDIMIWPETSFPAEFAAPARGLSLADLGVWSGTAEASGQDLGGTGQRHRIPNLVGVNCTELDANGRRSRFNSAVLIDADGRAVARYDKMHRVPFGEFVPMVDWFPFLKSLTPYGTLDYTVDPGTEFTRFPIRAASGEWFRFGVLICYEDSDSPLARQYVAGGDPVDFLVNISNDGWFHGTQEHEQHLAISRFRAVECRRSLVRSVNMGVSAIIDANGAVTTLPGPTWSASKGIEGVATGTVPIDRRRSLYAWWGDWLPVLCWLLVIGAWWRQRRRRGAAD